MRDPAPVLDQALARPESAYLTSILRRFHACREAPADEVRRLLARATWASDKAMTQLRDQFGVLPVDEYLPALGLRSEEVVEADPYRYPYFSVFDEGEDCVEVNVGLIDEVTAYLDGLGRHELVDGDLVLRTALAHEIMHKLDQSDRPQEPITLPALWREFRRAPVREAVGEVAAVWFSQKLMGLTYSPCIYEVAVGLMRDDDRPLKAYGLIEP